MTKQRHKNKASVNPYKSKSKAALSAMDVDISSTAAEVSAAKQRRRKEIEELRAFSQSQQNRKPVSLDGVALSSPLAQVCAATVAVEEAETALAVSQKWYGSLP